MHYWYRLTFLQFLAAFPNLIRSVLCIVQKNTQQVAGMYKKQKAAQQRLYSVTQTNPGTQITLTWGKKVANNKLIASKPLKGN